MDNKGINPILMMKSMYDSFRDSEKKVADYIMRMNLYETTRSQ
jgi:hypothetical protein